MKLSTKILILILILMLPLCACNEKRSNKISLDFDGDDVVDEVMLDGSKLIINDKVHDLAHLDPKWIDSCDLDGDGRLELFIAVKKSTPFHRDIKLRPFFFNIKDAKLYKKWTGSKFREDFKDIKFMRYNNRDLVVVHELLEDSERISIYYWFGFGFRYLCESKSYDSIKSFEIKDDIIHNYLKATEIHFFSL